MKSQSHIITWCVATLNIGFIIITALCNAGFPVSSRLPLTFLIIEGVVAFGLSHTDQKWYGATRTYSPVLYICMVDVIAGICNVFFSLVPGSSITLIVLFNVIVLLVGLIVSVAFRKMQSHLHSRQLENAEAQQWLKSTISQMKQIQFETINPAVREKFKHLYEALKYSEPVSTPSSKNEEIEISSLIGKLATMQNNDDVSIVRPFVDMVETVLMKRNTKCRH